MEFLLIIHFSSGRILFIYFGFWDIIVPLFDSVLLGVFFFYKHTSHSQHFGIRHIRSSVRQMILINNHCPNNANIGSATSEILAGKSYGLQVPNSRFSVKFGAIWRHVDRRNDQQIHYHPWVIAAIKSLCFWSWSFTLNLVGVNFRNQSSQDNFMLSIYSWFSNSLLNFAI